MSYLLITFWNTRIIATKSGMKAFLINRIGDLSIIIGMALLYINHHNLSLDYILNFDLGYIGYFFLVGAFCKSGQLIFSPWLLGAMAGPTPVSALLHAATMVVAGVYFLLRLVPSLDIVSLVMILGSISALMGGIGGLLENDIKHIIAFSTVSQLGYLFASLIYVDVSSFHLVSHSFFKALLFMSAGVVIHSLSNEQSLFKYGGLHLKLNIIYESILFSSLALVAFPYTNGFYSKDLMLELLFNSDYSQLFGYGLLYISAAFTGLYSMKILIMTFLSRPNMSKHNYMNIHEIPTIIYIISVIMIYLSVFGAYLLKDVFVLPHLSTSFEWTIFLNLILLTALPLKGASSLHIPLIGHMKLLNDMNLLYNWSIIKGLDMWNKLNHNVEMTYLSPMNLLKYLNKEGSKLKYYSKLWVITTLTFLLTGLYILCTSVILLLSLCIM